MEFTLFSAQPAGKSYPIYIEPLAVIEASEAEAKRSVDWLRHVWVPVALIEMQHGAVHVVEDWDRTVVARVVAAREKARKQDANSVSD